MFLRNPHHRQAALPLHLTLAMQPWLASSAVLRLSSSELQILRQSVHKLAGALPGKSSEFQKLWQSLLNDRQLAAAVEEESRKRAAEFLEGVVRYQQTPYQRDVEEFPCIFSCGSARLLDCGGNDDAPHVLLVPSLINRYYILDLTRKLSLAGYLASQGLRVFLVDWGSPSVVEKEFDCGMYVSEHLVAMAEWIRRFTNELLVAAGYCMGGLLATALASTRPDLVDALACFATPWDFSVPDFPKVALPEHCIGTICHYIDGNDMLPAETIDTLFHLANPYAFQSKLRQFARMKPGAAVEDFLAIEHWVQDGVPMAHRAAQDCLVSWAQHNSTAELQWKVDGRIVNPAKLKQPVFIAAPQGDRIVPSACALPLSALCRNVTLTEPTSGHVGMIVGRGRKAALWEPLCRLGG